LVPEVPAIHPVFAAILDTFVIAGVERGTPQLRRPAVITVAIPVATTPILVSITVLRVPIIWILCLSSHAQNSYSKNEGHCQNGTTDLDFPLISFHE
jgi:hypothetical protein